MHGDLCVKIFIAVLLIIEKFRNDLNARELLKNLNIKLYLHNVALHSLRKIMVPKDMGNIFGGKNKISL